MRYFQVLVYFTRYFRQLHDRIIAMGKKRSTPTTEPEPDVRTQRRALRHVIPPGSTPKDDVIPSTQPRARGNPVKASYSEVVSNAKPSLSEVMPANKCVLSVC